MNWQSIVETLGIVGIASGLLVYLLKALSSQLLSRDLEKYKADLRQLAFEHETRFGRLHEDRARVIAELYSKLASAHASVLGVIRPLQVGGEEKWQAEMRKAAEETNAFFAYFDKNRIYFDECLCELTQQLQEKFKRAWAAFTVFGDMKPASGKEWWETWCNFTKDVPPLRARIENEFRKMLGVPGGEGEKATE
jgi:hypothetical protein